MPNQLANEPSPYLQQHKDNPVDWYPWSEDALDEARRQDKPLLVSIGYSACHWCHVMAHESFENPQIAAYMNEHFINIKVDREERPDIDNVYMSAVQAMSGQGGWPLNMFATPDGVPFFGGTYWPPADRRGMPGFPRVLEAIASAWENDRDQLLENASRFSGYLSDTAAASTSGASLTPAVANDAIDVLSQSFDADFGGFGSAPKFPQAPTLEFLVRHYQRTGSETARSMLAKTLDRMAAGGIHDHLGGGFARYAVDQAWVVPHFEKMLYDNAQLMRLYLETWKSTRTPRYAQVAIQTGDWLLSEMLLPDGGFASALDADSEGVEGKYYTWTDSEIDELLGDELAAVFRVRFGITPHGNFEGTNILVIASTIEEVANITSLSVETATEALDVACSILRDHQRQRIRPGQDDKVVTAWNGLAISAFASVGATLGLPSYVSAAQRTARFLLDHLQNEDGTVWRTWNRDQRRGQGVLEDYTFLAEGLIHLHQADGDPSWLMEADRLIAIVAEQFGRPGASDFFDTAEGASDLPVRSHSIQDNANPAGNSVAADVMLTLGTLTSQDKMIEHAQNLVRSLAEMLVRHPSAFGRYLAVAERMYGPTYTLLIGGEPSSSDHRQLTTAALQHAQPAMIVAHAPASEDSEVLAKFPVFADRGTTDEASTAWLCREGTCKLPAMSLSDLKDRLAEMEEELAQN